MSAETSAAENCDQYLPASPDLISTVSIPRRFAFAAIALTLPRWALLTYQIHIPSPASGLAAATGASRGGSVVCERASPAGRRTRIVSVATAQHAAATARVRAAAIVISVRTLKHAPAGKAAPLGSAALRAALERRSAAG